MHYEGLPTHVFRRQFTGVVAGFALLFPGNKTSKLPLKYTSRACFIMKICDHSVCVAIIDKVLVHTLKFRYFVHFIVRKNTTSCCLELSLAPFSCNLSMPTGGGFCSTVFVSFNF